MNTDFFVTEGNNLAPLFPYINKKVNRILLNNSVFFRYLSFKINIINAKAKQNMLGGKIESFNSLSAINEITKKMDIPFTIINLVPAIENHCHESKEGLLLNSDLKNIANRFGIKFYNMCDYVDNNIMMINSGMPKDDHYNQEGYKIVADILVADIFDKLNNRK